jgi:hypothetical protein
MNGLNEKILKVKEELTECMKKEIRLMREVFANMHQEEIALIMLDRNSWNHTLQDRFSLLQALSFLRNFRLTVTCEIEKMLASSTGKKVPLEQILPGLEEEGCEILYLSEQILALIGRMNDQHMKNENLLKKYEIYANSPAMFRNGISVERDGLQPLKCKAAVATYPFKQP